MERVAVFVDAGYLYALGGRALTNQRVPQDNLAVNPTAAVTEFKAIIAAHCGTAQLLRVYWYDAAPRGGATLEQSRLAESDDFKVRLGALNAAGNQKGVDSMIVIDMVDLARNHSISDAVLLSGDEDVRIGIQIAQTFGVRVHLLGISPAKSSQGLAIRQEADTVQEWDKTTIAKFLSVKMLTASTLGVDPAISMIKKAQYSAATNETLQKIAAEFAATLTPQDVNDLMGFWGNGKRGVPTEFDGKLLVAGRTGLGKEILDSKEKRELRRALQLAVERLHP